MERKVNYFIARARFETHIERNSLAVKTTYRHMQVLAYKQANKACALFEQSNASLIIYLTEGPTTLKNPVQDCTILRNLRLYALRSRGFRVSYAVNLRRSLRKRFTKEITDKLRINLPFQD